MKDPDSDDGERETTAKLKPRDIPYLLKVCRVAQMLNPKCFENSPSALDFDADVYCKNYLEKEAAEDASTTADVEEIEDHQDEQNANDDVDEPDR